MKTLAIAMAIFAAATLPAAAMELHASQRPLTEHLSGVDRVARSIELARGRAFDRQGGNLFGVRCIGTYIGGWTEGYPATENAC